MLIWDGMSGMVLLRGTVYETGKFFKKRFDWIKDYYDKMDQDIQL